MTPDQFPARFSVKISVDPASGCWNWTASKRVGYGSYWDAGRSHGAHRFAYENAVGPIAEGLVIDHLCRNRGCVNPAHLEPVTNRENVLRGVSLAAQRARQTECLRGHPYDAANTSISPRGTRACRACWREKRRAYVARKRQGLITEGGLR